MIEFRLPSLGADMDEGTLLEWHVAPGDRVKRGQVVALVDTSKAAVDVEIWQDGVVTELLIEPGEKVPVGTVLARLDEVGGAAGAVAGVKAAPAAPQEPKRAREPEVAPPEPAPEEEKPAPVSKVPTRVPGARELAASVRHPVSPAARKRARELDIDPETVSGTGPHASVTIADIERAARERKARPAKAASATVAAVAAPRPAAQAPAAAPRAPSAPGREAATDRQAAMRKAIAAAMSRSKREIPHYYLSETIPMAAALDWLRQRNESAPITERVLPAIVLLKAVAQALRRTPQLNGFFRDGEFEASAAVHAGVAISLRGGGLVAPAIHDVGDKPLAQLMRELSDLVTRARAGSLRSSEMTDPTITVTNLGDQGVESVAGVIYPPQVAIVGFGRIAERPWAQDGWIRAVPMLTATLAADHRVTDGIVGARFLAELREVLQRPESLEGEPPQEKT
jgi:pyruvate dehydrogenase E2 component (dihydrolipoamide acetyltransferase)